MLGSKEGTMMIMPDNDKFLCISYFDQIIGPNILICLPDKPDESDFPDLTKILEFNDNEGSFVFAFRRYQSINHIFYLDSKLARGGKEIVMISFLVRTSYYKKEIIDVFKYLESKSSILEKFEEEIKTLKNFNVVLNYHKKYPDREDAKQLFNKLCPEFLTLFDKYFEILAPESEIKIITKDLRVPKKIFIIGPKGSGKTTFLKNVEALQFYNQEHFNLSTRIFSIVIDNIIIPSLYDSLEKNLENQQAEGYIYIFKNANETSLSEIKSDLDTILSNHTNKGEISPPILLIGNKFDNSEFIKENEVVEFLKLNELKEKKIRVKYFSIDFLKEDTELMEALRWLIKKLV